MTCSLLTFSVDTFPRLEIFFDEESNKKSESQIVDVYDFVAVKGYKAKGKRLTASAVKTFRWLDPLPEPEPEPEPESDSDTEGDADGDTIAATDINDREGYAEGTQTTLF